MLSLRASDRRSRRRTIRLVLLALGVSVLLPTAALGAGAGRHAKKTLTIGMEVPLTGALGFYGIQIERGADIAIRQVNASSLIKGTRLQLQVQDNRSDTANAISAYKGFVSSSKIIGGLCCTVGTEAASLKPVAVASNLPTVALGAANDGLPQPPTLYRVNYLPSQPNGLYVQTVLQAAAHWKPKSAVIVVASDSPTFAGVVGLWKSALAKAGIKLTDTISTLTTDTDFSGTATKITSENADLVIEDMLGNGAALLARSLQQFGYRGHLVSTYGVILPSIYQIGGSAIGGLTFATPYTPLSTDPMSKKFVKLYQAKYGEDPNLYAAQGYDAALFLALGIKNAGKTVSRATVAKALSKIKSFHSVEGALTMKGGDAYFYGKPDFLQWASTGTLVKVWGGK